MRGLIDRSRAVFAATAARLRGKLKAVSLGNERDTRGLKLGALEDRLMMSATPISPEMMGEDPTQVDGPLPDVATYAEGDVQSGAESPGGETAVKSETAGDFLVGGDATTATLEAPQDLESLLIGSDSFPLFN